MPLLFITESQYPWVSVLALSKRNTNAVEVVLFLHRLVQVLVEYFKELEEESIRDNFVIIYELMDEMITIEPLVLCSMKIFAAALATLKVPKTLVSYT